MRSYPSLHKEGELKGTRKVDKHGQGITVFVYRVTGTKEDLDKYEEIMVAGEHTCKDPVGYLWFTTQPVGQKGKLQISIHGKVFADTTANDLAQSLIKQYPGQLGLMLAKDVLQKGFVAEEEVTVETPATGKGIDSLD